MTETIRSRSFLGHPIGLYVLFLAQMWERFSYFGMLALLILYLNDYFRLSQEHASNILKWYTTTIYFAALGGAYVAERLLGNKPSVLLGAALMAVGHFLMAFPSLNILYVALTCLVVGFGLLTPPLTTQVGLLYPPSDPRRDSAYTIFYMGINLGGSASPLLCAWLAENTRGRWHSGFTVAGIGMVVALFTYLIGMPWIVEIDQGSSPTDRRGEAAMGEAPSAAPLLNQAARSCFFGLGALLAIVPPALAAAGMLNWDTVIFAELPALACAIFGWIAVAVPGGLRDRVVALFLMVVFSIVYWGGAGQYGNTFNLWADQNTNRYLTKSPKTPELFAPSLEENTVGTEETEGAGFWARWTTLFERLPRTDSDDDAWNPIATGWFQSVNPLFILLLAPIFAVLWPWLARKGLDPSIPARLALGLLFMALAFGLMVLAARQESEKSVVSDPSVLPPPLVTNAEGQVCRIEPDKGYAPVDAGRLYYDGTTRRFRIVGVLPMLTRDEIVGATAPESFLTKLKELQTLTEAAAQGPAGWTREVHLDQPPPELDLRYAGLGASEGNSQFRYDAKRQVLSTRIVLEEKEMKALAVAAGEPHFRAALDQLFVLSDANRVSPWWLIGFFLLGTMGEMCLAPVGMSMVSQLAPARFATMLMSLFLLTFAFGNFVAGAFGEKWSTWTPERYFTIVLAVLAGAALLALAVRGKMRAMMHEKR